MLFLIVLPDWRLAQTPSFDPSVAAITVQTSPVSAVPATERRRGSPVVQPARHIAFELAPHHEFAVVQERARRDIRIPDQRAHRLAGGDVPELDRLVDRRRGGGLPIRADGDGVDGERSGRQ